MSAAKGIAEGGEEARAWILAIGTIERRVHDNFNGDKNLEVDLVSS